MHQAHGRLSWRLSLFRSDNRDEPDDKFFGRFADRKRSAIKVTVKAGKNDLDPILLK